MLKTIKIAAILLAAGIVFPFANPVSAQTQQDQMFVQDIEHKSAGGAFLRSLVLPGWGHRYVDNDNWNRGRIHMGADVLFLGGTLGYNRQAIMTQNAMFTSTQQQAGVDIRGRDKSFQLGVAQFNSLAEYNLYQEQTRNWDRFLADTPENQWEWRSEEDRNRYNEMRAKYDDSKRQTSLLIGLMAVNRVVSGISAAISARNHNRLVPDFAITPERFGDETGFAARVRFRF